MRQDSLPRGRARGAIIMSTDGSKAMSDDRLPLVTIISCIYGVEKYIGRFLESVFFQTYARIDYVFVNDGTEDGSVEILENLVGNRFRSLQDSVTVVHKENGGLPLARAEGLRRADGDYFIFLDPDDWIEPDMIERMVWKAESASADLVYCDYFLEYPDRTVLRTETDFGTSVDSTTCIKALYDVGSFHSYLVIKMFRRTVLKDLDLFIPPEGMMEDMVFSTQFIGACSRIAKVDAPLYHYNKANPSAMTRTARKERRRQKGTNLLGLYHHLEDTAAGVLPGIRNTLLFWTGWCMLSAFGPSFFIDHPELAKELSHCRFEGRSDTRCYLIKRILLRAASSSSVLMSSLLAFFRCVRKHEGRDGV